ncbi:MAG: hypothetical protein RLZ17_863, partial [Actinomycetota bacterium]
LYSNIGKHFLKQGETPPLWRNVGESAVSESAVSNDVHDNEANNIDAPERN